MPNEAAPPVPTMLCVCPTPPEPCAMCVMPLMSMTSMDMASEEPVSIPVMPTGVPSGWGVVPDIRVCPRENVSWSTA